MDTIVQLTPLSLAKCFPDFLFHATRRLMTLDVHIQDVAKPRGQDTPADCVFIMAFASQFQAADFPLAKGHARLEYRRATVVLHVPVLRGDLRFFL